MAVDRYESLIPYEAPNHYYYTPLDLVEKMLNCEFIERLIPPMTHPERRKKRSEDLLKKQGIPINPSLPAIESAEEITLRSAEDIAKRAIGLCAVALRGEGYKQQEVISLLRGKDVLASATPEEKKFLLK